MSFEGTKSILIAGSTIRIGSVALTDASGGTLIGSGSTAFGVKLTNVSGTISWVGGTSTNAPFSGTGYPLQSGQSVEFNVSNLNSLRGVGAASGIVINYTGIDY